MADQEDATGETPQPSANPDAQTTVNDFLDYTEFFPSDLVRSLRLIGDLDNTYIDATQTVHDLTVKYGKLPTIPAKERPDPTALRKEIAAALDKAIYCRESTYAEATRLYEVAERHSHRIQIIKRKLQALPQPPSRDPTPAPVSPQATRSLQRGFDRTPHLRLTFNEGRYGGSSTARPRDRGRKSRGRAYSLSASDASDVDSEVRSTIDIVSPKKLKLPKEKVPKPPRVRPPGAGTNVHSSIAGISTSNALARLSPPPPDAKPGSKWAPWFKLTEYEMAVLRKQMKKNAVWTPSETMIRRELERKGRGHTYYEKEKARCEAIGEEFLDEEPEMPSFKATAPVAPTAPTAPVAPPAPPTPVPAPAPASAPEPSVTPAPVESELAATPAPSMREHTTEPVVTPVEPPRDRLREDTATVNKGMELNKAKEAKKVKRESQRQQAIRDAQDLEHATKKITEAADSLKELTFASDVTAASSPVASQPRRKSTAKPSNKRKRAASPPPSAETPTAATREPSLASQDSGTKPPEAKRQRTLQPILAAPSNGASVPATASTPQSVSSTAPSPVANTPIALLESTKTTTMQVPLAPEGPSAPAVDGKVPPKAPSRQATPAAPSPTEPTKLHVDAASAQQPTATAASSRPRRGSTAHKAASPPPTPAQPAKSQKAQTPAPEPARSSPTPAMRPRSARGHVPTPKAQSEEPKPNEAGKPSRDLRRHSIFSQSTITAPTRMSTRKKPPPKGDVTSAVDGSKTVTNVKRAQGSKNRKKKKADEEMEDAEEIDPNEPRYCICDDVSYGSMISCDNNCDREWFHLPCVNMKEDEIPGRRAKWYCPDCRQKLGTDAYGNPLVPPPLPGRRGNR